MANFREAVEKTLANEGGFSSNPTTGEVVNHGITVWFLRSAGILKDSGAASPSDIEYVRSLSEGAAIGLYKQYFWDAGNFGLIDNQKLANKAFDLAVNNGLRTASGMLQLALCDIGISVEDDGKIGPETATAANAADQDKLYAAYLARAETRYREVAERHPDLAVDLPGWLDRLHTS